VEAGSPDTGRRRRRHDAGKIARSKYFHSEDPQATGSDHPWRLQSAVLYGLRKRENAMTCPAAACVLRIDTGRS
jgi:hypothetical protein